MKAIQSGDLNFVVIKSETDIQVTNGEVVDAMISMRSKCPNCDCEKGMHTHWIEKDRCYILLREVGHDVYEPCYFVPAKAFKVLAQHLAKYDPMLLLQSGEVS